MTATLFYVCTQVAVTGGLCVGIVGAHGGLGRELVQQTLDRGWTPVPIVRRADPILAPVRKGWLSPDEDATQQAAELVVPRTVNPTECPGSLDALVFALSGKPFESNGNSTSLVRALCASLPASCRSVSLVSAHGVGDSIREANVGIQVMRSWYLRDTYAAKEEQEDIVANCGARRTRVVRPKVLSYSRIPFNPISTPRQALASDLLDWAAEEGEESERRGPRWLSFLVRYRGARS